MGADRFFSNYKLLFIFILEFLPVKLVDIGYTK